MTAAGRVRLSEKQRVVADTFGQGMSVMAGAGSGKTTTMVEKCARFLELNPGQRFVAISFTEKSAQELRKKMVSRIGPEETARHWVSTIHGFCRKVIGEFPEKAGLSGYERMLDPYETDELWQKSVQEIFGRDQDENVESALFLLESSESRTNLLRLLSRVRELDLFGALRFLDESSDEKEKSLGILYREVRRRFEKAKSRLSVLDFSDLERCAEIVLSDEDVCALFRHRFQFVLVDEFQDTNPTQAKLLERFTHEQFRNLCVVGDPKQSIYRFRDADLSVFEDFCSKLPLQFTLNENYRTVPNVLHWINQVCEPVFDASQLVYEPLVPKRESTPESLGIGKLHIQSPTDLALHLKHLISKGVDLKDCALLVRKIRGSESWLMGFMKEGIPIAVQSGGRFYEDHRVIEIVALLNALVSSENGLSAAAFLRAPWISVPDALIYDWRKSGKSVIDFFEPILTKSAKDASLSNSFAHVCCAIKKWCDSDGRLGPFILDLLQCESIRNECGAQLLQIWSRCEGLTLKGYSYFDIVRILKHSVDSDRREKEVPPSPESGVLQVLTIHASKGLEFKHVFLVDFKGPSRTSAAPQLFWDRNRGVMLGKRDESGERDRNHPSEVEWREFEFQKSLEESKRLFYVALTRARESLVLAWHEESKPVREGVNSLLTENWRAWVDASGLDSGCETYYPAYSSQKETKPAMMMDLVTESVASLNAEQANDELDVREKNEVAKKSADRQRVRHSVSEWMTLKTCRLKYLWATIDRKICFSTSNLAVTPTTFDEMALVEEKLDPAFTGIDSSSSSAEYGSKVHRALELNLSRSEAELTNALSKLNPKSGKVWSKGVKAAIDCRASLYSEVPFELKLTTELGMTEILVGSIDLIEDSDDTVTVTDFKIVQSEKSDADLLSRYELQLMVYGLAAIKIKMLQAQSSNSDLSNAGDRKYYCKTRLIVFSDSSVRIVEGPDLSSDSKSVLNLERKLGDIVKLANSTIGDWTFIATPEKSSYEKAFADPGKHCRYCQFLTVCSASTKD